MCRCRQYWKRCSYRPRQVGPGKHPAEAREEPGDRFLGVVEEVLSCPHFTIFEHSELWEDKVLWLQLMKFLVF